MKPHTVIDARPWGSELPQARPDLIAPGSATYEVLGDAVVGTYLLSLFTMPLLHPATAAATGTFDKTFSTQSPRLSDYAHRLQDTVDLIAGVVYAGQAGSDCAYAIRELHRNIKGDLPSGERYHAWTNDTWTWNWAAITEALLATYGEIRGYRYAEQRAEAYDGLVEVGRQFGVRGMPDTYARFEAVWPGERDRVADTATATMRTVAALVTAAGLPRPRALAWLPDFAWRLMSWPLRSTLRVSLRASMPSHVLDELQLCPGRLGAAEIVAHRTVWRLVPRRVSHGLGMTYFAIRRRWGTPIWRGRFSREALEAHRKVSAHKGHSS